MDFNLAFDRTLKKFHINAKELAVKSEISAQTISDFRRGKKSIKTDNLGKLLGALPAEAISYFFSTLLGSSLAMEHFIAVMDSDELSGVMFAVARRLKSDRLNSRENSDASDTREAVVV